MTVLAIDIGATKIAVARIAEDGGAQDIRILPVPASEVWEACRTLLLDCAHEQRVGAVGIACAGPVDMAAHSVAPLNIPEWRAGFGIADAVQELFPGATVEFAIDGVCAALAEQRYGAARGVSEALMMVVSSGIGGGLLTRGRVGYGRTGNAGHIGHVQVSGFDDPCACGNRGCVEAVASGPASVRWARRQGWSGDTGSALAAAARDGEAIPLAAMRRAGTALGQAICSAAALLDVGLVVVGGGFAQSGAPLWDPLLESAARNTGLGFLAELRVVPSMLAQHATLIGAGVLATQRSVVPG